MIAAYLFTIIRLLHISYDIFLRIPATPKTNGALS